MVFSLSSTKYSIYLLSYMLVSLLSLTRPKREVDGILFFGPPVVAVVVVERERQRGGRMDT